jgi:tRNA/tmRNA/rRNA uracil-C5-methylase (TrmA/RlmC/RlmD family)
LPEIPVISGSTSGFRHRARLAIRGRLGSPKLGLFELNTHHVVHIPNCSIQHPLINRVANVVRRALVDAQVTSYSDAAHLGLARYLQVVVERSSQAAQVVLVGNSDSAEPFAACFDLIRARLGSELHSLWFNANRTHANTILGPTFQNVFGPASVVEHFGGAPVHYPPGAFGQSNLEIAERIIEHVRAEIPQGARVTEFYAGVGAIGLSVLARASEIRLNEVSAQSLQGIELGLAQLDSAERAKISVVPGPAGAARLAAADAQVVIADPPRKGLDPELTEHLIEQAPERFVYVSCGLESFLHDTARLTSRGTLRLAALTAFNLMPFTEHVEIVARFER